MKIITYSSLPNNAIEIPSCPTYYATPDGEIWRKHYATINFGREQQLTIIKLKPYANCRTGYCQVQMFNKDIQRNKLMYVHRLILETFVGPCPDEYECDHIDKNRANNNLNNLRWVNKNTNIKNRGPIKQPSAYNSKLKPYKDKINKLAEQGYNSREIIEMLNLPCVKTIHLAKTNKEARKKRLIDEATKLAMQFKNNGKTKTDFFREHFPLYKLLNENNLWKKIW